MRIVKTLCFGILLVGIVACEKIPSHIIRPDKMTEVLVDIHKAEAISENIRKYGTPEGKEALKRSIYKKHDITQEAFDTSLVWYSKHMKKYSEIYKTVSSILKAEDDEVKVLLVEKKSAPLSSPGDSVNVWNKEPFYLFEPRKHRRVLTFDIPSDDNYREDDIFQLSVDFGKLPANIPENAHMTLLIKHRNDSVAVVSTDVLHDGVTQIQLQARNNRVARVMGSIEVPAYPAWQTSYADHISLLRIRYKYRPNLPKP